MRHCFVTIFSFLILTHGLTQERFPANYFRSPLDIELLLSGNFAELRSNHFHSGIDIKTQGKTGLKVYAAADGFVSRIKISPYGYGKAIYIDHPNGFTTVYGHLSRYNKDITQIVREIQYERENFAFDTIFTPETMAVKKGEIIAFSGNSGASSAPHLHYEIRDTNTENPLNPLFFGLKIKDNIPPKIFNVYIYPLDENSHVNFQQQRLHFAVAYKNGKFILQSKKPIIAHGKIGFGVDVKDFMNYTHNKYGIYSFSMQIDDENYYYFQTDEFSFEETRFLNAHIDYEIEQKNKRRIYRAFALPAQNLSFINHKNKGIFNFSDSAVHRVAFYFFDMNNNLSILKFEIQASEKKIHFPAPPCEQFMPFNKKNIFFTDSIYVVFPKGALYDNLSFQFKTAEKKGAYSKVFSLHNPFTPLQKKLDLYITPHKIPQYLKEKVLIVIRDEKELKPIPSQWIDDALNAKTDELGDFMVTIDTLPPVIKPLQKNTVTNSISFTIEDDLSGIKSYRGTLNGKWVLFEFDPKKKRLIHFLNKKETQKDKQHHLFIQVTDFQDNSSKREFYLVWNNRINKYVIYNHSK